VGDEERDGGGRQEEELRQQRKTSWREISSDFQPSPGHWRCSTAGAGQSHFKTESLELFCQETHGIETAVASTELWLALAAKPMYPFCAMLMVWVQPSCTQFTPSVEMYPLKVLPLRFV
jgi:hypothetical protein